MDWPVTRIQKHLLHRLRSGLSQPRSNTLYVILQADTRFDLAALEVAVRYLATRHAAFRVTFTRHDPPRQHIGPIPNPLPLSRLAPDPDWRSAAQTFVRAPFDPDGAPLWRAGVMPVEGGTLVVMAWHYVLADTGSRGAVQRSLCTGLAGRAEERTDTAFLEYSQSLEDARSLKNSDLKRRWESMMAGATPVFDPVAASAASAYHESRACLSEAESAALRARSHREGASLPLIALAALTHVLAPRLDRDDLLIRMPYSARGDLAIPEAVGHFGDTLAYRVPLGDDFAKTLAQARLAFLRSLRIRQGFVSWDSDPASPPTTPVMLVVTPPPDRPQPMPEGVKRLYLDEPQGVTEAGRCLVAKLRWGRSGLRTHVYHRPDLLPSQPDLAQDLLKALAQWGGTPPTDGQPSSHPRNQEVMNP